MAIINNSFKFVFVHVPKAAGTSITSVLSRFTNYCDLEIGGTEFGEQIQLAFRKRFGLSKHSTATEIRNVIGPVTWSRYFTFTFVRDPFSRCLSTYHFLRNWESPNPVFTEQMRKFSSFKDYVMSHIWDETNGPDEIFRPQSYWVRKNPGSTDLLVDFIGRVEAIHQDMSHVLTTIGLAKATQQLETIPVLNKSQASDRSVFDSDAVVERIVERYKADFDIFGYPPNPAAAFVRPTP